MRLVSGAWSGTATFSIHLADSGTNTTTLNFGARGGSDFMVRNGTGTPLAGDSLRRRSAPTTTYYLVARLSKPGASTTYDQIDMWLNPARGEFQRAECHLDPDQRDPVWPASPI